MNFPIRSEARLKRLSVAFYESNKPYCLMSENLYNQGQAIKPSNTQESPSCATTQPPTATNSPNTTLT
jgi:hypothetical protein